MQRIAAGESFNRRDRFALRGYRQRETRIHPPIVHEHRACPALAMVASLFCTGQANIIAQSVEQRHARIDSQRM
jgi:hypothetical protein